MAPIQPLQLVVAAPTSGSELSDSYWRSLYFFNGYRFVVALLLLGAAAFFGDRLSFGSLDFRLFVYVSAAYVMFGAMCFVLIASRRYFHTQLSLQIGADVLFIVVLMFASGGISSGLGLLLLSGLAAAGLISRGGSRCFTLRSRA
jgi:two-component system sensor histidine kinase PilS (NtrC family)